VVLALVCFGLVMVFSASSATALLDDSSPLSLVTRQAIYALIGLGLYLALSRARPGWMREVAGPAVAVTLVLLLAVLAVGAEINGAKRWIDIGPIQIQNVKTSKIFPIAQQKGLDKHLHTIIVVSESPELTRKTY